MGKERLTTFVPPEVKQNLDDTKENRSLSNHVADILTKHVEKNKPKPYVSKVEYADTPKAIYTDELGGQHPIK